MGVTHLTEEQRLELDRRHAKFSDRVTHTLGFANFEENDINVKESYPLRTRPYRIAPGMFADLKGEIDDLISKGIIVPSRSPWSSPMVPLRKKRTGHVRFCIDYRKLNKITISDPYQMQCIEDLLNLVSDAVWLSKLDLNKGFYQVPLSRGSQDKTAFFKPWGKYAFTRMPVGLKNAPAAFQRCMQNTLAHLSENSSAYIDDILIYFKNWEDHLDHIEALLLAWTF